ncbi:lytic polysaccharide monooxygenase [Actinoplanes bogorensis]|uniref:Lytic polysaccharide monooxygenase n=1 Tax=Paractinoplanes bogorensis TaxID=1610840 RepID=A0ABS5YNJ4_9ACTN|nr:lytic polysaccharide monooxygenase [Actinoplanes bogorensis]MBU2664293.1 lytic polysaccharide monooxygenase [Actinoplanes bogorensis]
MRIDRLAAAALAVTVAALIGGAHRAEAHGSPTTPISRTAACADGGEDTGTAACKAARKANGGGFGKFDNLRIAGVNGKDRQVVPDGKLCSGGLDAFQGLDLPRDDFPATKVTPGKTLTIRYRATIPHAGEFRVFLTGSSYDPSQRLTWDDLGSKPIAAVTDPDLNDGAYLMKAKLPERTGRQILYIVWETSSTPDTYYSCSDLVFPAAAPAQPAPTTPATTRPAATKATKSPTKAPAVTATSAAPAAPALDPVSAEKAAAKPADTSRVTLGHWIVAGALLLGFGAIAWAGAGTFLRRRRENR